MSRYFEEIDCRETDIGEVVLQRRRLKELDDADMYEVVLNGEYLMSSLFTVGEIALSEIALDLLDMEAGTADVVVGGLGLGYTADAALTHSVTKSLMVVEYLQPVIDWHQNGMVPIGRAVSGHSGCTLSRGDFFGRTLNPDVGLDPSRPGMKFDAVLLDVDHSPSRHLEGFRGGFYEVEGMKKLAANIRPGGVFGLWSDDQADEEFIDIMAEAFDEVWNESVYFPNPLYGGEESNSIYIGRVAES